MKRLKDDRVMGADILVRERIEEAHNLLKTWEAGLKGNAGVSSQIEMMEQNVEATQRIMGDLGVVEACRWCEEEAGGSCCGAGIENRYSSVLLLVNLLLGVRLPQYRERLDSCYFLTGNGCCLKVRHVLCVNYLCARLQTHLSPEGLISLQTLSGEELDTGFVLYETIKKIIGR